MVGWPSPDFFTYARNRPPKQSTFLNDQRLSGSAAAYWLGGLAVAYLLWALLPIASQDRPKVIDRKRIPGRTSPFKQKRIKWFKDSHKAHKPCHLVFSA